MMNLKYITTLFLFFLISQKNIAQTKELTNQANLKLGEEQGYQNFLKHDASSQQALKNQKHKHTPYETSKEVNESVIYLSPKKIANTGCVNMGFDQYNFTGWTGQYGIIKTDTTIGSSMPVFSVTGNAIVNTAGNNTSLINTINYHTLMTKPAINPIYPICNGYDSLACKVIGTNTVSQIPVVSPYSQDLVSVRLNGANGFSKASRLKYITTTSANNQQISYSFATVLNSVLHNANEAPYFKVVVKNETTGLLLPGCNSYTINPATVTPSDSLLNSVIDYTSGGFQISYRKWQLVSVDLSSLPLGTDVSITFEVGGCSIGGHWGYAYVDAECSSSNIVTSNMCAGSSYATLIAPQGMLSYQWYDTSNAPISGATNDSLIVSSPNIGDVYTLQMTAIGGCVTSKTIAIATSSVYINNILSIGSCISGSSGSTSVFPAGTNAITSYTWTSVSTGSVVGNTQTAINLAPGIYSVNIQSGSCGQAASTISVPIIPINLTTQTKFYCGNTAVLTASPLSTNIKWYKGSYLIPSPIGASDSLIVSNPSINDDYTLVFTTPQGCVDSIRYVFKQTNANSVFISNIGNTCVGATNGSAIINLNSNNLGPFNYFVYGQSGLITNIAASSTTLSLNSLAIGNYSINVYEGVCIHTHTFSIVPNSNNYTLTPSVLNSCNPSDTVRINFNYGNVIPTSCGLSSSGSCVNSNQIAIGTGTLNNTSINYPSIYGNYYENTRHQILYRANELLAAGILPGKLSSIAFNITAINGTTVYPGFTIKMKCTTDTSLNSLTFDQSGLSQVYYSSAAIINVGWNKYQFSSAYEWDGMSNILVDVCNSLSTPYTRNSSSPYTTTAFASVRYITSDVQGACSELTADASSNKRPNVQFENCSINLATSYSISVLSNGIITRNYNNDSIKIVPTITPTAQIIYTISIIDPSAGCVSEVPFSLISPTLAVFGVSIVCEGSSSVLNVNGASTYTWSTGETTPSITITPTVSSSYIVTGENVCGVDTKTVSVIVDNTCQDVWPGDANSDGVANNLDVLELGLHYIQTGQPRATTSNAWQSYFANNWVGTITNGKNLNHSDCNGDGTINDDDTLAIYNNYGLTHTFKMTQANAVNPQINIVPDQATVTKGNWGTASVYLGAAVTNINAINGVAFTVDFDNTLIETNSIYIEYQNSFLNATNQNLHFRKLDFANGKLFTASTHTVSNNVSGFGKIATLHYQIKSNLATDEVLNIGIAQANQSEASGAINPLASGTGTLMALGASVGLAENIYSNSISINPNPTNGVLTVTSKQEFQKIEVMAITGQVLLSETPTSVSHTLHLEDFSNGIYFINIYQNNHIVKREKVVLNK
jgi:hypothetical protein